MTKAKELILNRFPKFVAGNLLGTLVDTLVLWVFSHFVFHSYVGEVIISPIISFECAVFVNFLMAYYVTWKDRISQLTERSFFRHYGAFNASCTGTFLLKMGVLMLIQWHTKWDVVICNLLALCVSGIVNYSMNEFVIFKKRKNNMKVNIREVKTKSDLRKFVHFPNELYKDNPSYVPQIESMDRDTLTPSKNHAFEVCEGKYWLANDENGRVVGRVAAIINHRYNKKVSEKICRFGWIDYVEDRVVSEALMDAVETYAKEKGMEIVSGPTGFLEFDAAGILVEGFDQLPTAYGKYNAPYYEDHLLALGYEKEVDFVEYRILVPDVIPDRYARMAKLVAEKHGLHQAPLHKHSDINPYIDGIFHCMNAAYSKLHGFSELTPGQCEDLKKQFLSNVSVDYLSIILDINDNVVGFGVALPSLSKAMQKAKGSLFPFGFVHVLKALKHNDTIDLLLIAIDEQYQNKGVNAMIFDKFAQGITKNGIKYIESTRELEDNTNVQNLWNHLEHHLHKRARVYKKNI